MKHSIQDLTPKEVLALAITIEQANQKSLHYFSEMFDGTDDQVSRNFEEMSVEESYHEEILRRKFRKIFKGPIPEISQFDVEETAEIISPEESNSITFDKLKANQVYPLAYEMEKRAKAFYEGAMQSVKDEELSNLFKELATMEGDHALGWKPE